MIMLSSTLVGDAIRDGYDLKVDAELFDPAFREPIRHRGWMTRDELLAVGRWKAVRATGHMNTEDADVRTVTAAAFAQFDPWVANWTLRSMSGVGTPMASAILTVFDPSTFTVIDRRAVATLAQLDYRALGMPRPDWLDRPQPTTSSWVYREYVFLCRSISRELGVELRDLDRALWALNGQGRLP